MNTIDAYLALPYTIELIREDDATWFARVVELPGCMTEGDSAADAAAMVQDAMTGWIELALADGRSIPQPSPRDEFSGKFVVRVPKSLHRDLVEAAAREQVSLNQFIATELARAVGRPPFHVAGENATPAASLRRPTPASLALHEEAALYDASGTARASDHE
jgi:antitoxin HicB